MLLTLRALGLTVLLLGAGPTVAVPQARLAVDGTEFV